MQTEFQCFVQQLARSKNNGRFLSILLSLVLVFGNLQLASAVSSDMQSVAVVNRSMMRQDTDTAKALALAMGVLETSIISADLMGSDPRGVAVITTTLGTAGFPTEGATFAVLATGLATDASLPNNEENRSTALDGLNNSQGQDLVQLHLQLKVPDKINCASFDLAYYSEEFAEYVGQQYNDTFTAQINASDLLISENAVSAPGNSNCKFEIMKSEEGVQAQAE